MRDEGNGNIIMSLGGNNKGYIYYKDHKLRILSKGMLFLANSFKEFIESLVDEKEYKKKLKRTNPSEYDLLYGE